MTKYARTNTGFFLVVSMFMVSLSAESRFRFFSSNEDLPSASISGIAQDSRGFLWLGSQSGLIQYDGVEYTTFSSIPFADNTLSSNLVQTIMMDSDDVLWAGTYAGLDRFDIKTATFKNYNVGNDVVVSLLRDSKNRLWAGTLDGLGCMLPGTDYFQMYSKNQTGRFIENNTVRNLYEDTSGTVFASTYEGLHQYDEESDSFVLSRLLNTDNPARTGVVYGVKQDAFGMYWIAKWGEGLIRVDPSDLSWKLFPLKDNRIYCFSTTFASDRILVGTWGGGLNVLDIHTGTVVDYTQNSGFGYKLTNDIVYSMFTDRNGLLFIGTNGGGLNLYDPNHSWFSSLIADPQGLTGLPSGKISEMAEDSTGEIWIAVTNKGLTRYNPVTGALTRYMNDPKRKGSLVSNTVSSVFKDSRNTIYLGTDKGLARYTRQTDSFSFESWYSNIDFDTSNVNIGSIGEGPDGSLWVGTYERGIVRYFPDTGEIRRYIHSPINSQSLSDNLIYFCKPDSRGDMWIGTNRGLNRFNEETATFERFLYAKNNPQGISSNTLYSFYEHRDGTLWFGTRNGGLCSWNPDTEVFSHFTTLDGLPSDTIVGVSPSQGDFIWVATQNGLVRFNTVTHTFVIYKTSDGLLSQQFNIAHTSAGDGRRYFGTPQGVVFFNEKNISSATEKEPQIALVSLTVNNEKIPLPFKQHGNQELRFRTDQKNIAIGYSAIDYSPLAKYVYSYILEGFETKWNIAVDRKLAMYTNLSPGHYTFRVRTVSDEDKSGTYQSILHIIIEKPLFLRWYFLLLYFLVFIGMLYVVRRIRKSILLEHKVGELEKRTHSLKSENTQLEYLSYRDALTGLANRRYFEYAIHREWDADLIRSENLSVIMIDIDYFKLYNDTFGHQAGDHVLGIVSAAIKTALFRISDVAARYGGEEFVIVLSETNEYNTRVVCDRVMAAVAAAKIPFKTEMSDYLTVSIGAFTAVPNSATSIERYIQNADKALYQSKNEGRNRISVYTG